MSLDERVCWKCGSGSIVAAESGHPAYSCAKCRAPWPSAADLMKLYKVVEEWAFTLSGGRESGYYVNVKERAAGHPELLAEIAVRLEPHARGAARVAGPVTGGALIAAAVSLRTGTPVLFVRTERRRGRETMGEIQPGDRVVLFDDVATGGGTLLRAVGSVQHDGGVVERAVVVVDREEGARKLLRSMDPPVRLAALCTAREVRG